MPPICMPTKERPVQVVWGDCLRVMSTLSLGCVDAVITDPPYGLRFMGKEWDHGIPGVPFWEACLRVAKPGAFLLAFGGTRTWHRLACAVEDAGWEIRDTLCWLYGTGFPKAKSCLKPSWEPVILAMKPSLRVPPLNIDETRIGTDAGWNYPNGRGGKGWSGKESLSRNLTTPTQATAGRWPANVVLSHHESCECRGTKRIRGTHRVCAKGEGNVAKLLPIVSHIYGRFGERATHDFTDADGMETVEDWACHQDCPVRLLDEQAGERPSHDTTPGGQFLPGHRRSPTSIYGPGKTKRPPGHGDSGGPSRFFYCSKASKAERGEGNNHATVKPLALMRWLVRLVSFPGDLILDPFAGSGTTGLAAVQEGRRCLLVEKEQPSVKIIRSRLASMAPEVTSNGADSGR